MLESLYIRNLALVSELQLDFETGLNVVTGETGAGKSLVIGAMQLLAGGRASPAIIRKGEKACEVAGVVRLSDAFAEVQARLTARLEEAMVPPCEEGKVLLRRLISENGSRAFINSTPVTAAFLKEIGELLIDIHGPNDSQNLLLPVRQLELLDVYAGCRDEVKRCRQLWQQLSRKRAEFNALASEELAPEEVDLLEHQLKEIGQANVRPEEEAELLERHRLAAHARRLVEVSGQCADGLAGQEGGAIDQIALVLRQLREIAQYDPQPGGEFCGRLERLSEQLQELADDLTDYAGRLQVDDDELAELDRRISVLQKLKRKYGATLADVLQTGERIRKRLDRRLLRDDEMQTLRREESELQQQHEQICVILRAKRQAAAQRLGEEIADTLQHLGFNQALFEVCLSSVAASAAGSDAAEFCFAPNVGEGIQPLRLSASSGEIARVMLAVKAVLSEADTVPILVFDEIDANIGGVVAGAVAEELRAVGRRHQTFCITHLPLIAAAGSLHLQVSKDVSAERTYVRVRVLSAAERVDELVRMLGAQREATAARQHATQMLEHFAETDSR